MPTNYVAGRFQAFDSNGDPLAGGKLYSYVAGTLTPQATYTTSALSTQNANPVELDSQGRATVWLSDLLRYRMILTTAGDVTITDDDNIQSPPSELADNSSPTSGAGLVSYSSSLAYPADTVGRRLQILSRTTPLNVRDYGVLGNDNELSLVDETAQMQSAINDAAAQKRELWIPGTNYLFGALTVPSTMTSMALRGDPGNRPVMNMTQALADAGGTFFTVSNPATVSVTIGANILTGQQKVTLASTAGLSVGMMIRWSSNQLWPYDNRGQWYKGEVHLITRIVSDTVIEIHGETWDAYDIAVETLTAVAWVPSRFEMSGLHLKGKVPAAAVSTTLLSARGLYMPRFEKLKLETSSSIGGQLGRCWFGIWYDVEAVGHGRGSSLGYGISDLSCVGTTIDTFISRACRRGVDFNSFSGTTGSAPSRKGRVTHFDCSGGGVEPFGGAEFKPAGAVPSFGVGTHGPSEDMIFENGRISNIGQGVTVRGRNTTIRGIKFNGNMAECIGATYGTGLTVTDCEVDYTDFPDKSADTALTGDTTLQPDYFIRFGNSSGVSDWIYSGATTVFNNKLTGLRLGFITFVQNNDVTDLNVYNNTVSCRPGSADTFSFFHADTAVNITDSTIGPNVLRRLTGSGAVRYFAPSLVVGNWINSLSVAELGDRQSRVILPNNQFVVIRHKCVPGSSAVVTLVSDRATVRGVFQVSPANLTLTSFGLIGSDVNGSASPLNGTTGSSGKFTLFLSSSGELSLENRMGGNTTVEVTVA
jgi:hypothetical protein